MPAIILGIFFALFLSFLGFVMYLKHYYLVKYDDIDLHDQAEGMIYVNRLNNQFGNYSQ